MEKKKVNFRVGEKRSLKFREVWSERRFGVINILVVVESIKLIHAERMFEVGKPEWVKLVTRQGT